MFKNELRVWFLGIVTTLLLAMNTTTVLASDWSPRDVALDCTNATGTLLSVLVSFSEERNPAYSNFPMYGSIIIEEPNSVFFVYKKPNKLIVAMGSSPIAGKNEKNVGAMIDRQTGHFEMVQLDSSQKVLKTYFVGKCSIKGNRLF